MSDPIRTYMRLVVEWLFPDEEKWLEDLDDDDRDGDINARKDAAFAALTAEEKELANQLVQDIFGEYL